MRHAAALEELFEANCAVTILSWMGPARVKSFYDQVFLDVNIHDLLGKVQKVAHTLNKTGKGGKHYIYKGLDIKVVFDDSKEVCQECHKGGMWVFPILNRHENHAWWINLGFQPYRNFAEAVKDFLRQAGRRT